MAASSACGAKATTRSRTDNLLSGTRDQEGLSRGWGEQTICPHDYWGQRRWEGQGGNSRASKDMNVSVPNSALIRCQLLF